MEPTRVNPSGDMKQETSFISKLGNLGNHILSPFRFMGREIQALAMKIEDIFYNFLLSIGVLKNIPPLNDNDYHNEEQQNIPAVNDDDYHNEEQQNIPAVNDDDYYNEEQENDGPIDKESLLSADDHRKLSYDWCKED